MKVPAVYLNSVNGYRVKPSTKRSAEDFSAQNRQAVEDLSKMPYIYPISFTSIQNSSKLRILFSYGLPCMYSGVTMIDPKQMSRFLKTSTFNRPAPEVLNALEPFNDTIGGMEARVLDVIRDRAKVHPDKNIQEILKEVSPVFQRRLRKKQTPVFKELKEEFQTLPEKYQRDFAKLMSETDKKLNEKPIIIPFSSYEFKYKLSKIKEDILKTENIKAKKVMKKLIKESNRFSNSTNANTIENQKKVLTFLEIILKKSVLRDNAELKNLIELSKSRLYKEEIIVPFKRKSFIYDLAKIINDLPSKREQEKILNIAQKLPTSQESLSAYVLKAVNETPEKIGHRIMWPYLASVEHIFPRSCGGADSLSNFGGATTRTNSMRKNIDFVTQLRQHPEARENCQKYVDRLIELYHQGIFAKHNINPKYIEDFKNTIAKQSRNSLILDISKFYEPV